MMKKAALITIPSTLALFVITGCATTNPGALEKTERDSQTYVDKTAGSNVSSKVEEEKHRVAVIVKYDNNQVAQYIGETLDSTLSSLISNMAFFEIVDRSNLDALQKEEFMESLNGDGVESIEIPTADYLITAMINGVSVSQSQAVSVLTNQPYTKYEAQASVDFRFYEKASKRTILTENVTRTATANAQADLLSKLKVIAQETSKAFAMELGSRYAPPGRVLETRGAGKVARVSMGSNYGMNKGVKVEFFKYIDNSDLIEGATREVSTVGYGIVTTAGLKDCWVEISAYKDVNVMRGHYVRISADQSKGFRESMIQ
jgi:curli biogenesis system outer membrane secretion channel CsgG